MSASLELNGHSLPLFHHQLGFHKFSYARIPWNFSWRDFSQQFGNSSVNLSRSRRPRFRSFNGDNNSYGLSDASNQGGSTKENDSIHGGMLTSNELLKRLKRYGMAGVLSYGLLNTAYYLTAFLLVWFYVAPAPGRMGYLAAAKRFLKIMAMVWAGSQVTKLVRAGGALALAPFVDRGLSWFTVKFKFESQGKAFMAIVGFCVGLAIVLFMVLTMLWA